MNKLYISFVFLCVVAFANAGVAWYFQDGQTTALVENLISPAVTYEISIPSSIDYIIEPAWPISIYFDGESDGLDWYSVYYTNPMEDPISGTLATVTLTFPATFTIAWVEYVGDLTVWDSTLATPLDATPVWIVIPEPTTVLLLGVGGVVLRRRR